MTRRTLLTAATVIALVTGGVLLGLGVTRSHAPAAAPLPPTTHGRSAPSGGPADRPAAPLPTSGRSTASVTPIRQSSMAASSIKIPALEVTAAIGASKVVDGVLTPPRVPTEVGEWGGSAPLTASRGEVTIAGHVNWAGMGPFAFGKLAYLQPGHLIYTTDAHGTQSAWRVTSVTARLKSEPIDTVAFAGNHGPRRLALITCGGAFDAAAKSYNDNVYVYASPAAY
jgi:hypothetical protein